MKLFDVLIASSDSCPIGEIINLNLKFYWKISEMLV